jgi:hypothetical protein
MTTVSTRLLERLEGDEGLVDGVENEVMFACWAISVSIFCSGQLLCYPWQRLYTNKHFHDYLFFPCLLARVWLKGVAS